MQVPEKLALIGGSILLASTLIFTLKSQASHVLPRITAPLQSINTSSKTVPSMVHFNSGYQDAKKDGWQTGKWGEVPYYIDDHHNMHIGSGNLRVGHLRNIIGENQADNLVTLSIDGHVKAPDATFLFSTSTDGDYRDSKLVTINGIGNVDFSSDRIMMNTFASDTALRNIDLDQLDFSHAIDLYDVFNTTPSLHMTTHWNLDHKSLFGTFDNSAIHNEP